MIFIFTKRIIVSKLIMVLVFATALFFGKGLCATVFANNLVLENGSLEDKDAGAGHL